jgi:hypothetical protein
MGDDETMQVWSWPSRRRVEMRLTAAQSWSNSSRGHYWLVIWGAEVQVFGTKHWDLRTWEDSNLEGVEGGAGLLRGSISHKRSSHTNLTGFFDPDQTEIAKEEKYVYLQQPGSSLRGVGVLT